MHLEAIYFVLLKPFLFWQYGLSVLYWRSLLWYWEISLMEDHLSFKTTFPGSNNVTKASAKTVCLVRPFCDARLVVGWGSLLYRVWLIVRACCDKTQISEMENCKRQSIIKMSHLFFSHQMHMIGSVKHGHTFYWPVSRSHVPLLSLQPSNFIHCVWV